jgi:hypothetical protein
VVQPQLLSFTVTQGGNTSASQSILLSSDSSANFTATAQTTVGANWLSVQSSGGQTPATLGVSVQAAGLSPGIYTGSVVVASAQALNSPLTIPVTMIVSVQPQLLVLPTQLSFVYQLLSGPAPPQEALVLAALGGLAYPVSASVATSSGGNWLSADPGTTTPGLLQVGVNPAGLMAGNYSGTITLNSPGLAQVVVPVTFRVTSARF